MDWTLPPYSVESVFVARSQVIDWGLKLLGIPELWKTWAGMGIRVAVLDTGTPNHPDVAEAVIDSKDFTGSRFGPLDIQGHGTFCCGEIAARDNGIGVIGVAPECNLICGKVLGDNGSGSSESVARGIEWAIDCNADIISMSLGSPVPDQRIYEAIKAAARKGIFCIVAAGNSGPRSNSVEYPGRWPECIAVGSMNQAGKVSTYSSRGPEVDLVAPGEQIVSTYLNGSISRMSGTSMACPMVAGIIALALGKYVAVGRDDKTQPMRPTPAQMVQRLRECCTDMEAPGFDVNSGWGLVDPKKLVDTAPVTPVPIPSPALQTLTLSVTGHDLKWEVK